jgi:hypothetical protein
MIRPTGVCAGCSDHRAIRGDGMIRVHYLNGERCSGSDRPPVEEPATVTADQIMNRYPNGGEAAGS